MHVELDPGFAEPPLDYQALPAADPGEALARLRLIRSRRVGPATYTRLMAEHGTAAAALLALPEVARAAGVSGYEPCPEGVARAEMRAARKSGARLITQGDPGYPDSLRSLPDAPPLLWVQGDAGLMARPCVALVGTRNASSLGARMARKLAADLGAAGFVTVSGLARGIDTLAHEAALATGTIAVMSGGLDQVYPAENTDLAARIAQKGLSLSEQPFGLAPRAQHFPRRNRIVAGLAQAVIVVEAAARSGSLITARLAAEQGREVMAVPGHPMDSRASGCNILIRDGATLVRDIADILEVIGPAETAARTAQASPATPDPAPDLPPETDAAQADATDLPAAILSRLGPSPTAEDQLIREMDRPQPEISRALARMELQGMIERRPGGLLTRTG